MMPQDPIILLSYINTQLRDRDKSLAAFCETEDTDEKALCVRMAEIGYEYSSEKNQFI